MARNRLVGVGIIAIFLIAPAVSTDDDSLNLTPGGESASGGSASRKRRSYGFSGAQAPFPFPESQWNSYFHQNPFVAGAGYFPQSPAIGNGQSFPNYGGGGGPGPNQPPGNNCGDRNNVVCRYSKYRSIDGSCYNPQNPTQGRAGSKYGRLLPANYADGVHEPRRALSGNGLPSSRRISFVAFPDDYTEDKVWTSGTMQWGQIVTHDMAMSQGTTQSKAHPTTCCTPDGQFIPEALDSPLCFPIIVPEDDPVHGPYGVKCMDFVRATTDLDRGCSSPNEPAEQINVVTPWLDLSLVYGSDDATAADLREFRGGRLRVEVRYGQEWAPTPRNKTEFCDIDSEWDRCYLTGDRRANQNPQLAAMQNIYIREHNRIARILAFLNPHWNDEKIYQEARRIAIALHQHITYDEWLPIFLGKENTLRTGVTYETDGYVDDYSPYVDPSVLNEHSHAAFRYFHTLIAGRIQLVGENRCAFAQDSLRLSNHLNRPTVIEKNMDHIIRGLASQPQAASDNHYDPEITEYLFRNGKPFGVDLHAIDIQRGRDVGLSPYVYSLQYCGLIKPRKNLKYEWSDLLPFISREHLEKLASLYESVYDIDLNVGGSLENHVKGTLTGPTFLCILSEQFYRTRVSDPYWYENSGPHGFEMAQLREIRKTSYAKLLCDNGHDIKFMQREGFRLVSETNPLLTCHDIPEMDLSHWKEPVPEYHGGYHHNPHNPHIYTG